MGNTLSEAATPIKIDSTSNGEFVPIPLDPLQSAANNAARELVSRNAKRLGLARRDFLKTCCAVAGSLLAIDKVYAQQHRGGFFAVPEDAQFDEQLAKQVVDGDEFIFDIQGHFVDPSGRWLNQLPPDRVPFSGMPKAACALADASGKRSYLNCLGPDEFIKDVFLDSDTDMMVLSFVPSKRDAEPLTIEEADAVRQIVEKMEGRHRLLLHGRVNPNQDGDLQGMDELAEKWHVAAWKTYTQWGPDGKGFFLHDEKFGLPFIEKARKLGVKNICIHKGIPFGRRSYEHSQCSDIGVVAKMFPDVNFIIYHSGFVPGVKEQAFAKDKGRDGIDTLVQSLLDNDIAPNGNVYAELGSTWRFLMRDTEQAAHAMGKLLRYVGEDNVLWGTDSIWYGSPQDQIQAFRAFQISDEFQEKYGYPKMTPRLRQKIFGMNATIPYAIDAKEVKTRMAGDTLQHQKLDYANYRRPHFSTYGPRTRREFLNLLRWNGGERV